MRPTDAFNTTAIHEAGHAAACLNLGIEFEAVYLEPSRDHPGLVPSLVRKVIDDYRGGVLTPEQESHSTNLVIMAFAGPVSEALHRGRTSFDIMDYLDLDEVLDMIEYRFSNNTVRMAFTRYCEAEAWALFEDDRRLWRYTNLLARELAKHRKLTYAQCLDLYTKEYFVESWVRKEVEEIRRAGEAGPPRHGDARELEEKAASLELRAVKIESGRQGQEELQQPAQEGEPRRGKRRRGGRRRGKRGRGQVPTQDGATPQQQEGLVPPQPVATGVQEQKTEATADRLQAPPSPELQRAQAGRRDSETAGKESMRVQKQPREVELQPNQAVQEGQVPGREEAPKSLEVMGQAPEEPRPAEARPAKRRRGGRKRAKGHAVEPVAEGPTPKQAEMPAVVPTTPPMAPPLPIEAPPEPKEPETPAKPARKPRAARKKAEAPPKEEASPETEKKPEEPPKRRGRGGSRAKKE